MAKAIRKLLMVMEIIENRWKFKQSVKINLKLEYSGIETTLYIHRLITAMLQIFTIFHQKKKEKSLEIYQKK